MLKELGLLVFRNLRASFRNPVFIIMGVMMPLIYLALYSPLLNTLAKNGGLDTTDVLKLFVPGMLPIMAFSTGIFTGFGTIDELRSGIIERFRVTPASRFAIMGGFVFFDVCATVFQTFLFVGIALFFGFRMSIVGFAILLVLLMFLAAITSAFGNAIGMIVKSEDRYAPITHALHLPMLLLSGALLPISLAPTWLKVAAHFNPVYYVVEAARSLAMGDFLGQSVLLAFGMLFVFSTIVLTWATSVFRKAVM